MAAGVLVARPRRYDLREPASSPPPRLRAAVQRPGLLTALRGAPLIIAVAPAGFGKTSLLTEWCASHGGQGAWLTLDHRHDDAAILSRAIGRVVDRAHEGARGRSVALVLDDVHTLVSRRAREVIADLARRPAEGIAIALASRAEPPWPVARLRAEQRIVELRQAELAMTRAEAAALWRAHGLHVQRDALDRVMRVTEGWPALLSLIAIAQRRDGAPAPRVEEIDRMVAAYLEEEVLAPLSDAEREFVQRTSILQTLSAARCDAVLERTDGAAVLGRLRAAGFPLVSIDRVGERYRHHRLLRDTLHAELRRQGPGLEKSLHRRAGVWDAQAGDLDQALRHAIAADDLDRAGELVWIGVPESVGGAHATVLEHRISLFTPEQVSADARLALPAAGIELIHGRGEAAEHWLRTAAAIAPVHSAFPGVAAAFVAALGRDGLIDMRENARSASALLPEASGCQALCRLVAGVADALTGDPQRARGRLEDGARRAAVLAPLVNALCLAELALIALDADETEEAARLAFRARAQIERHGLERYAITALPLAVSGLSRAQRGLTEEARADLCDAAALAERMADLPLWYAAQLELVLARAALRLGDAGEARTRLLEVVRMSARMPEACALSDRLAVVRADLAGFAGIASRSTAGLTTAELRVLQFLPTHLNFRAIAERTGVSANTIKTQANAVYRKLVVRSRFEAVERARELGLLDA